MVTETNLRLLLDVRGVHGVYFDRLAAALARKQLQKTVEEVRLRALSMCAGGVAGAGERHLAEDAAVAEPHVALARSAADFDAAVARVMTSA